MSHDTAGHTVDDVENKSPDADCKLMPELSTNFDENVSAAAAKEDGEGQTLVEAMSEAELDESSSNSNSTQSSEATNGSIRKKRRRGEDQILMEHLSAIDKSLADGLTNQLRPTLLPEIAPGATVTETSDTSSQTGDCEMKKSKEDSPAFHLRPRRSHKASGYCSSGSSSPIFFLSPIKRSKQPLVKKSINSYTHKLLSDTSRQLSQILNDQSSHSGHNESSTPSVSLGTICQSLLIKDEPDGAELPKAKPKNRSYSRSIMCDVDVSVFSELITPSDLTYGNEYPSNYISMKIIDIKPLRYVQITHPDVQGKVTSPLLELRTLDLNDRFLLAYTKGVFDHSSIR